MVDLGVEATREDWILGIQNESSCVRKQKSDVIIFNFKVLFQLVYLLEAENRS